MIKSSKSVFCVFLAILMVFAMNVTAFAADSSEAQNPRFLPDGTFSEDVPETRVPNLIPITVNPYYNKLVVHVGNLGVDSLDSVTVSGSATAYGSLASKTYSVPPVVGKDFTWNVPQTKCHMEYDVTIRIIDGSGTDIKTGHAELDYTNEKLSQLGWGTGRSTSRTESLDYHFNKHHSEVGTSNMYDVNGR